MTIKTKTCSKCGKTKLLDEFHNHKKTKGGKYSQCKECANKQKRKYRKEHPEMKKESDKKYRKEHKVERRKYDRIRYQNNKKEMDDKSKNYYQKHKDEIRQKQGHQSMYKNKSCSAYFGIVIGERLCKHLFKDVEVMPHGNPGFDIICNKGKMIDVKTACKTLSYGEKYRWSFHIEKNNIADYFILVAFDNRVDLNLIHMWMIPGYEINNQVTVSIHLSTIHKWGKYKMDINNAQLCCTEMKNHK